MILFSEQSPDNVSKRIRVLEPVARLGRERCIPTRSLERLRASRGGRALTPADLGGVQLIFLHLIDFNLRSAPSMREALGLARQCGVRVVVDTDDAYFRPADHGPFDADLEPHLPVMRELCGQADLVTVTGDALRDEMLPFNANVEVLPNSVDDDSYRPRPRGDDRMRIGWCGGPTHLHDLSTLMPAIRKLQRSRDFDFVLFGLYDDHIGATLKRVRALSRRQANDPRIKPFATFARSLDGVSHTHHPSVQYADFPRALRELDLDIGLCPLRDTVFNRCRSALKFYQYAAVGTVTVASDVVPYRGECESLSANTVGDWERTIAALIDDADLRADTLRTQQDYVREHRSWQSVAGRYGQTLLATSCRPAA